MPTSFDLDADEYGNGHAAPRLRRPLYLVGAALIIVSIWASFARLDVIARAEGQVVALGKTQLVQSLEGGIVKEILVAEGDTVEAGQPLARINDVKFGADLGEVSSQKEVIKARIARLEAELAGNRTLGVTPEAEQVPLFQAEQQLLKTRLDESYRSSDVLKSQLDQRLREVDEARERAARLTQQLSLAQQELDVIRPLVSTGSVAKIEQLRLAREVAGLAGELSATKIDLARAADAVREVRGRLGENRATFLNRARAELTASVAELAVLDEKLRGVEDRVARATIRAPAGGTVNRLEIGLPGAVLQPGQTLMEITPSGGGLLIELRVRPQDIALLHAGQTTNLKFSAYDYAEYGTVKGVLSRVGADTITDSKGYTFYKALVKAPAAVVTRDGRALRVLPGMTVTADIIVGDRSVRDYLFRPIEKAGGEVFRER